MFNSYTTQYKKLIRLGTPVILSQIGVFFVQIFDNAMVGSLGGPLPLAAVSLSAAVFLIMFLFVTGMSMAITPLIGEAFVQGKKQLISSYLLNGILLFTGISILVMLFQLAIIPVLYHLKQPVEVVDAALPYYRYLVWSIIPYMIFCCFERFWEGVGNTRINMCIIITANLINIFLNWLLIFGNWGFPRMEVAGAGLGTFISRISMVLLAVTWFVIVPKYRSYLKFFNKYNIRWCYNYTLLKMGLPISFQTTTEGAAGLLIAIIIGWMGTAAIASHQIVITVAGLTFMFALGLSAATTIRVSHEFGLKNLPQIRKVSTASLHLMVAWNVIIAVIFIIFRGEIITVFNDDPMVILIASKLFLCYIFSSFFDGLQIVTVGQLRGIQDVKMLMPISFLCFILLDVPLAYFLAFTLDMGPVGPWISIGIAFLTAFILFRKRFLKQMNLLEKKWIVSETGK